MQCVECGVGWQEMDVGWGEQDSGSWWPDQYVVPSPAQPSPAQPQVQMSQKAQVSARASSPQPAATMLPHIWSLTSNIDQLKFCCWKERLSLNLVKTLLYLISWSYKTIFPYSNIFGWCPHILTQINVFLNLSKYLMIEYEVALKNTPESIERIDCIFH